MGKRHKKNKKEKNKKHKNQCQTTLLVETGNEQAEFQSELKEEYSDKEQRRITRLGAIVGIIAVVGTVGLFLFKMTINLLDIWSVQGLKYWYLQALFLLALATVIILGFDIVWYLISDLKRHNVIAPDCKRYDEESDYSYSRLIMDFEIYIILLFIVFLLALPVSIYYSEGRERCASIVATLLCGGSGVIYARIWIKRRKEKIRTVFWDIIGRILIWLAVGGLCFVVGIVFVYRSDAMLTVKYNMNGIIEIDNTSTKNYDELQIVIFNMNDELVYEDIIEEKDILVAKEATYVSNEVEGKKIDEGRRVSSERVHWKYEFDFKQIENMEESGYIVILVRQDSKEVLVSNSFLIKNDEYNFAKECLEKEY